MQLDDCGYHAAVPVLLNAGSAMEQRTPPATVHSVKWKRRVREPPKSAEAVLQNCAASKKRGRDPQSTEEETGSDSPDSGCCGMSRPRPRKKARKDFSAPSASAPPIDPLSAPRTCSNVCANGQWDLAQSAEQASPHRVLPNYPDAIGILPPGARRRAVNVIYLMSKTLNLEICTPSLGVLIMDRFLSSRETLPSCRESVMLTAMICLNAAGKVADVDKGFCGSHGVMVMVRDATPSTLRQQDHVTFAKYTAAIEREVLRAIDSTLLSCPCAMQIIANITNWFEIDEPLWLRAAIICDVFSADSASTRYTQTQIAKAVVGLLTDFPTTHSATCAIAQSIIMFVNSAREHVIWKDPYFGVRRRHADNPELVFLFQNAGRFLLAHCATPETPQKPI
jgi:hypothetical protein